MHRHDVNVLESFEVLDLFTFTRPRGMTWIFRGMPRFDRARMRLE